MSLRKLKHTHKQNFSSCFFLKDGDKSKEEALPVLELKPKQGLLRQRKQCWKVSTATQKEYLLITHLQCPRHLGSSSKGIPYILRRAPPEETNWTSTPSSFPLTTEPATKKIGHSNILVFIVDVQTSNHQIKQAVKSSMTLTWLRSTSWSSLRERKMLM